MVPWAIVREWVRTRVRAMAMVSIRIGIISNIRRVVIRVRGRLGAGEMRNYVQGDSILRLPKRRSNSLEISLSNCD